MFSLQLNSQNKIKYNLSKPTRIFLLAQALFVLGVFVAVYIYNSPRAISPATGKAVSDPGFTFEIEKGSTVLLSRDLEFSSPIVLEEGSKVILPPGTYYWKVKNWIRESEVYTFSVESNVALNLREGEEKTILENAGTVDVDVIEEKDGVTRDITISVGKSEATIKDANYEGKQDG